MKEGVWFMPKIKHETESKVVSKAAEKQAPGGVRVIARRELPCGEIRLSEGDALGTVNLTLGVSMNFFIAAMRNGLASIDTG